MRKCLQAYGMDDGAVHGTQDRLGDASQQLHRGIGLSTEGSAWRGGSYLKEASGTFSKVLIQRHWLNNFLNQTKRIRLFYLRMFILVNSRAKNILTS